MVWLVPFALLLALIPPPAIAAPSSSLTIGNYTLVGKTRVGRLDYQLTYQATLSNHGDAEIQGATARLTNLPGILVVDGQLSFGRVGPKQSVLSSDSFTLRWPVDRAISPKILQQVLRWQIASTSNAAPGASAGPDQTVALGATVTLDGSASGDPDGGPQPLAYRWTLVSKPAGSTAVLSGTTTPNPSFVADKAGSYLVQLIVNDGKLDSDPARVTTSTENSPPVAWAGADRTVRVGDTVMLDASGSTDVDGDPLSYHWSLTGKQPGGIRQPGVRQPRYQLGPARQLRGAVDRQ